MTRASVSFDDENGEELYVFSGNDLLISPSALDKWYRAELRERDLMLVEGNWSDDMLPSKLVSETRPSPWPASVR